MYSKQNLKSIQTDKMFNRDFDVRCGKAEVDSLHMNDVEYK